MLNYFHTQATTWGRSIEITAINKHIDEVRFWIQQNPGNATAPEWPDSVYYIQFDDIQCDGL